MTRIGRWVLTALTGGAVLLGAAGCQTLSVAQTHRQAVDQANQRWRSVRTNLLLQAAQRQFDTGDLDQADKTLGEALAADPASAELLTLSGRVCLERGQLERAYHYFATALGSDNQHADALYYQGLVLQRWQQFDGALANYQQAYRVRPDHAGYLLAASEMLVALGRHDEALQMLLAKVGYFDQNAAVRVAIAHVYLVQKNHAQAAEYLRQASLLRPDDLQIQEDLALAEVWSGQGEAAVRTLTALLRQPGQSERRDLQRLLAQAYRACGRTAAARSVCLKLTQTDATDADAWRTLSRLSLELDDAAGAQLAAQRAVHLAPRQAEGHVLAALAAQKLGQTAAALAALDQAQALEPQSTAVALLRGLTLEQSGQPAAAAQAYRAILERQPAEERARQLLARLEGATAQP